ncbi:hypothetical protein B0T11DRAFT_91857 [Plectosphaerella cucumerina]|uniref:C2H2-type domain-containing protein n=1 Tax=Plectosphaerella cucumerina TaxID=40658 RepID=A0A8K0X5U2_9PEZI|nr:hypothetical protein B0T11DRAFT_91857 [Plectosphaerella cucumerina]
MPSPGSTTVERRPSFQPFQCVVCQSRFTRHENLKRHAALHTRSQDDAALPCDFCQATFSRPDLRHRHMKRKHPEQEERRARKRPQRECRDSQSPRDETTDPSVPRGHVNTAFVSPVSISTHTRGCSNPAMSSDEGEMEVDIAGSWQSTSTFSHGHFDTRPGHHAALATSLPSSTEDDEIRLAAGSLTQMTAINPSSNMDPNLVMAAPFLGPTDRFDANMHPLPASQTSPFGSNMTAFTFDQEIPEGLLSMDLSQIQDEWMPSEMQIARGRDLFFVHVSHFVPFLHQHTLDTAQIANYLLLSMLSLAYQHGEDPDTGGIQGSGHKLSVRCYHRARLLVACDDERAHDTAHSLSMVQAYLLLQIHAMMYMCGAESSFGLKTHSKMISLARAGGLMQPTFVESATTQDLDALWRQFVHNESQKRTAFAVHQVDALWYQFLSVPRSLSHLEIKHDLPCPDDFWTASSSIEWAHRQLVSRMSGPNPVSYTEAVRRFLSDVELTTIPPFDPYGAINITQFLISSAREISGWSTMTGRLSMERLEPLKSSLLALSPFIRTPETTTPPTPHALLCEATWQTAMMEMQMWSPSHTGGIVESSMDAVLQQLTFLAPSSEFLCESNTAKVVQPHVDWFLRYLDATGAAEVDSEAPWITLYAYKAFMIAWQLVRGGSMGSMQVVGVADGDTAAAMAWAKRVFRRRERWQLGKIILNCLDSLEK